METILKPGDVEPFENSVGMKFQKIPKGKFSRALLKDEGEREDDQVRHEVEITKDFHIGTTEVTPEQWYKVIKTKPWKGKEGDDIAASYITWNEAKKFCEKLTELEAKEKRKYRLPTEAEWEYACRAGTQTSYSFGDIGTELDKYAWYRESKPNHASQVALKKHNQFGLYDMHGNVWEWCSDWYDENYYENSPDKDPQGPKNGTKRVCRGGSFKAPADECRSAYRDKEKDDHRSSRTGFRVVMIAPEKE